jgi:hypothetical protein
MTELVVVEDGTILMMLRDSRYADIPCLTNKAAVFQNTATGCSACARKRKQKQREEMARIKSCLAVLAPEKKILLKQLLDARKVRVTYVRADGEVVQLTF